MFYQFSPNPVQVNLHERNPNVLTAGLVALQELPDAVESFGLTRNAIKDYSGEHAPIHNIVEIYEHYTFGIVNTLNAQNICKNNDRIGFFILPNTLLLFTLQNDDNNVRAAFEQAVHRLKPESITLEKLLYAILENVIAHDPQILTHTEFFINEMEESVVAGHPQKHLSSEIYRQKKRLLLLKSYYEQLIDLGEALQENQNELFGKKTLHYFVLFTAKAQRLSDTTTRLLNALSELRSAHQAALDYSLNNAMKLLTVIATIFLPLTLIVGWYGMNFTSMPELQWEYGYVFVIALSIVVILLSLIYFKKKNLF